MTVKRWHGRKIARRFRNSPRLPELLALLDEPRTPPLAGEPLDLDNVWSMLGHADAHAHGLPCACPPGREG
jgi:hypothetical protein